MVNPNTISVVIPTLNEEKAITQTIKHLVQTGPPQEIIVSDGQSSDQTLAKVKELESFSETKIIGVRSPKQGRGAQMNFGASFATGDILLFLHADTKPSIGWHAATLHTLQHQENVAGFFRFAVDEIGFNFRILEWGTNLRVKLLGLPYGDQGLFLPKTLFQEIGGFFQKPLLEDIDILWRLQKYGKVSSAKTTAITSARRFKNYGVWRMIFRNFLLAAGFHLGLSPEFLSRFYQFGNQ